MTILCRNITVSLKAASQKEGENLDQFCTRLKQLSVNCDFTEGTVENEVKTQMIHGLSKPMDLKILLDHGKSMELAIS